MATKSLSPQQTHALFDVLTHHESHHEIQRFKYPNAIDNYGPPFEIPDGPLSDSPILQTLLHRFVLQLPGLKDVKPEFWQKRVQSIIRQLGDAELSESYDKGTLGSRRTLATAISTLIEYPARGVLGGLPKKTKHKEDSEEYDVSDPDDIFEAWDDFLQDLIYGDMMDELFKRVSETDKLEEQSNLVKCAHEYILVNLATFLHYIMVLSPDGPYLTRVVENIHKLVPYGLMRPPLRVGNAATMINGMVKLLLTKLSVNSVTSWFGLTNPSDAGMNLMQQVVSTVIGWDITELKKQISTAEKHKDAPSKEHLNSIKDHIKTTRDERERRRAESEKESKSIAQAIFDSSNVTASLSDKQHDQAMDYLSIQLSIRDREQLLAVFCNMQPDLLTQSIRDAISAYDPVIRSLHQAVDLSGTLTDLENFLTDFVKVSKGSSRPVSRSSIDSKSSKSSSIPKRAQPTVEDFVQLLRKHQGSSHRFLHQVAKNSKELTKKYRDYAESAVSQFKADSTEKGDSTDPAGMHSGAGAMTPELQKLFSELPEEAQMQVSEELDAHSAYLMALHSSSRDRMRSVLAEDGTPSGPGIYLAKWQHMMDSTKITPSTPSGPVRTGKDPTVRAKTGGVGVDQSLLQIPGNTPTGVLDQDDVPDPPTVSKTLELLGPKFRKVVGEKGRELWT
ncbi:hypothetical protein EG327_001077 [Venturia inaequalis]|uniref:PX-associated-domain-containing protein n=1 Tax=Venturia inaequalis TaxID=5025 RepID=A0A8H3VNJ2_VENIN|nr:hypothetical protein EG327_001077 [Venturia inaequalis]